MDQHHFTAWTRSVRSVPSRRDIVRALAGAGLGLGTLRVSDAVAAKDKKKRKKKRKKQTCRPNCVERTCGNDGCGGSCGACGTDQVCHGGTCCVPESRSASCAGRCGTWTNNCGQSVTCAACATGQQCLSNGSCAVVCDDNADCTGGCGCSNPSVEGARHCIGDFVRPLVSCTNTTDCPPGAHCQDIGAASPLCISVCH
ncbi:MAG: hypothetical protein K0Q71_5072 [Thermomicrobiales bacterium]|nr:hypothetical protein [Thermomicrobiales bacterium]